MEPLVDLPCLTQPKHITAQRALQMWRSEAFTALVRWQAALMVPALMPALIREGKVCPFVCLCFTPPPPLMYNGKRPIGAVKGKQTNVMASCQPPPPRYPHCYLTHC